MLTEVAVLDFDIDFVIHIDFRLRLILGVYASGKALH